MFAPVAVRYRQIAGNIPFQKVARVVCRRTPCYMTTIILSARSMKPTMILSAALMAAPAIAQTPAAIRVTMAAPVAKDGSVRAMATTWICVGTVCTGPEINGRFGEPRACREVAKAVGAVTAYAGPHGELSADELAKCNKSAKKTG